MGGIHRSNQARNRRQRQTVDSRRATYVSRLATRDPRPATRDPRPSTQFHVRIRRANSGARGDIPGVTTAFPDSGSLPSALTADVCVRALAARDARFDGLFFVGITSTRIYCRPVCPARVSHTDRRRFFGSAAAAERAGFRPCLRCRPELAPGRAPVDAVSRLGYTAARRIEAGALNGHTVTELAAEFGVSARHLRRALEREYGVAPGELAQTYRLLMAKRLLADTTLPVTRIAFASGFQSLRRFNAAFREQYRMAPSALRRAPRSKRAPSSLRNGDTAPDSAEQVLRLTLAYRVPFDWQGLLTMLRRGALPAVELVDETRYIRTVRLDGHAGIIHVTDGRGHLVVDLSSSLVPALMPLLPRLRRIFDLDAEPLVIDDHLARAGLGPLVHRRPGVRLPGTFDPFDVLLSALAADGVEPDHSVPVMRRLVEALGQPLETSMPGLGRLAPDAASVADAGAAELERLGMSRGAATTLAVVAGEMAASRLRLDPGCDAAAAESALQRLGVSRQVAVRTILRALHWPDAFPETDPELLTRADQWRPWRAYGAVHLWLTRDERHQPRGPSRRQASRRNPEHSRL